MIYFLLACSISAGLVEIQQSFLTGIGSRLLSSHTNKPVEERLKSSQIPLVMDFDAWKELFEKDFPEHETEMRRKVFNDNVQYIKDFNEKNTEMWLGVNQFSHMTHEEFRGEMLGSFPQEEFDTHRQDEDISVALNPVDWRTRGCVTAVKNQAQCGSCWSFSATGAIEGAWCLATGQLESLSEQQIVDCDTTMYGCNGGLPSSAFDYVIKNGGIAAESDYTYHATDGQCNHEKEKHVVATIERYVTVPQNEQALAAALTKSPVSVAIEVNSAFQSYRGGIFRAPCGTQLDHAVLAVGFTDNAFIVKNSWGASWGDHGYIYFANDVGGYGQCGIAMQATYPISKSGPSPTPGPGPDPTPTPQPASTTPQPTPTPGSLWHNPFLRECEINSEIKLEISGVSGAICAPYCDANGGCPAGPAGTDATPTCAFSNWSSGEQFCGLMCDPSDSDACNSDINLTCEEDGISGRHYCMYQWSTEKITAEPYEHPNKGCNYGEISMHHADVGTICSPLCNDHQCPSKFGVAATPYCMSKDESGRRVCDLLCDVEDVNSCDPDADLVCKSLGEGDVAVCVYEH